MASGTIKLKTDPKRIDSYQLTGFASESGFKNVIATTLGDLSVGQLLPVYANLDNVSVTGFYNTYYSGFLSRLTSNRGWGILGDAFGRLFLVVLKDGVVTFTAK